MALHHHCVNNEIDTIKEKLAIAKYHDIIDIDEEGNTMLHFACYYGHLEIVLELLKYLKDGDIFIKNGEGCTPLHNACQRRIFSATDDYLDIVKELIKYAKYEDLIMGCIYGHTPLQMACLGLGDNVKIVKELMKHLEMKDIVSPHKYNALYAAACLSNIKCVKSILKVVNECDLCPVYIAVYQNFKEMIKLLVLNGYKIDDYVKYGNQNYNYHYNYNSNINIIYNDYIKTIKWSKADHKNVMYPRVRKNVMLCFMIYNMCNMPKISKNYK